jgi:branched-chain amino acid transport system substrate-binding protein
MVIFDSLFWRVRARLEFLGICCEAVMFIEKIIASCRPLRLAALTLAVLGLPACSPPEPVRLGFLGGLSGRVADLGIEGRNGATLAVELRNKAGGVKGRPVELLVEDDQQNPDAARRAVGTLIERKVAAIVGPMTSAMATVTVPLVNQAQLVMISPTVTTTTLTGIDDYFFRVLADTTSYASKSADYHFNRAGLRRVAAAFDLSNRSYAESWLEDYRTAFTALGGKLVDRVSFSSGGEILFADLARQLLKGRPDGVLILANSVDAAMLCQHLRRLDSSIRLATSEWAATEQLVELGGKSVEGIMVGQFLDRQGTQKDYLDFQSAFFKRFGKAPGFAGLKAFDAANVALEAIAQQSSGQTLKQSLLTRKTFPGTQAPVVFDSFGDTSGETFLATVKDGSFVPLR